MAEDRTLVVGTCYVVAARPGMVVAVIVGPKFSHGWSWPIAVGQEALGMLQRKFMIRAGLLHSKDSRRHPSLAKLCSNAYM